MSVSNLRASTIKTGRYTTDEMLPPHNDTSTLPPRAAKYVTRNSTNDEQNIIININYNLWNYSLITVNLAVTTEVTTSP